MPKHHKKLKHGTVRLVGSRIDAARAHTTSQANVLPCGAKSDGPPKNTKTPCDIAMLQVNVATGSGKDVVADFSAAKKRIYEPVPPNALDRIKGDLGSYDFVIEAVSADPTMKDDKGGPASKEIAEATISTSWHGACPIGAHSLVVMHPLDSADSAFEHQWRSPTPPKMELPARSVGFLNQEFGWTHFPKVEAMAIQIRGESCGVRFDKTPVDELCCLLRIYRKDDWVLKLKLPPLSERKSGYSKSKNLKSGEVTTSGEKSHDYLGSPISESAHSTKTDSKGNTLERSASSGSAGAGGFVETSMKRKIEGGESGFTNERTIITGNYVYGSSSSNVLLSTDGDEKSGGPEGEIKPSLSVQCNGSELNCTKVVNSIIHVIQLGSEAFHGFQKLLKFVPKVGFTLDLSLSFFEGSITYSRGYRVSKTLRSDRYTAVVPYVDITGKLTIIEATIEMGIGFDITIPNIVDWFKTKNIFEVVLKLSGKITLSCELECSFQLEDEREKEIKLKPEVGFLVHLVAAADILGVGIRTEVGVTSDGLYASGVGKFTSEAPPTLTLKTGLAKGDAYGYYFIDGIIWDTSDDFTAPLWDELTCPRFLYQP